MTLQQSLLKAIKTLRTKKIPSAQLDAEVLLSLVLNKPKEFIYTHHEYKLTQRQLAKFKNLISKRIKGKPIAYLINHKEFFGLDFYVDENVLIPRPETELLVDEVLIEAKKQPTAIHKPLAICDVGTGSGCLAISLKKFLPKAKIIASDISEKALKVAKLNAKKHKVKIQFIKGNLLEPSIKDNFKIDILVANLPYLTPLQLEEKFIQAEPKKALFGGKDGLRYFRRLFGQISLLKYKPKAVFLEIDPSQSKKLTTLAQIYFEEAKIEIKKDLAGWERMMKIRL
jgi:release factor glutamine methyltransferase